MGNSGANVLDGGAGDDRIDGGAGADTLIGGAGTNTVGYSGSTAGVAVDLEAGTASGGDAGGDLLSGFQNMAGSDFADTLAGDSGANALGGGIGDDFLEGRGGADVLDGGDGIDTASYAASAMGVTVNLATGIGSGGDAEGDRLKDVEILIGSANADTLTGATGDNRIEAGAGNDVLRTGGGNDVLDGGSGFDTLTFGGAYGDASITRTQDGWTVADRRTGETTTLADIEAIAFTEATVFLDGRNNAPVVESDTIGPVLEDTPIIVSAAQLLANDRDFEGDEFVLTGVSDAVNGTVALDGFNNVIFTPAKDFNGEASFAYTVKDSRGGIAKQTVVVDVSPVQDAPVAVDDWQPIAIGEPAVLRPEDLLANDHDADGDVIRLDQISNPVNGTVAIDAQGSIVFTPIANYFGDASFDYSIDDGQGGTATATARFKVVPSSSLVEGAEGVESAKAGHQVYPSVTVLANGGHVVTWASSQTDSYDIYAQIHGPDGAMVGAEFRVNSYTTSEQYVPKVTALAEGGFVVTWMSAGEDGDGGGVFGQRYDAAGVASGAEFRVNEATASNQMSPSVAPLASGGFVVVWESTATASAFARLYDRDGHAVGGEFRIDDDAVNSEASQVAALADGGFVVAWRTGSGDIYGRRYDGSGQPAGAGVLVAGAGVLSLSKNPTVVGLMDGGYVIGWDNGLDDGSSVGVYGQRYDAGGTPAGGEFRINTYTNNTQHEVSLAATADGGFVATWTSIQDGPRNGVYGQRFDAAGVMRGGEFQVNDTTAGYDHLPAVAARPDGGFVVAWTSYRGSQWDLYTKTYAASGGGDDTLFNTSGDETLAGGSGNDIYLAGRGTGHDVIDNHGEGESNDKVVYDAGIQSDQLWFSQSGNGLDISVIGTNSKLTIADWFGGTENRVAEFHTADGNRLFASQVANLVQAMAAFSPPTLGQTELTVAEHQQLDLVIASNWKSE